MHSVTLLGSYMYNMLVKLIPQGPGELFIYNGMFSMPSEQPVKRCSKIPKNSQGLSTVGCEICWFSSVHNSIQLLITIININFVILY